MFRGSGDARDGREIQSEFRDVRKALAGTVGTVHHAEVVEMQRAGEVRLGDVLREHLAQGVLLQRKLCDGKVDRLRVVRRVAVLPVRDQHHGFQVVHRDADGRVVLDFRVQAPLEQPDIRHLADDRRSDPVSPALGDLFLYFRRDFGGCHGLHSRLQHQRVADSLPVPGGAFLLREGVHEKREVRGFPR
ncbi:hypothetical protein SDC9_186905 [bioreactor metagenome]|uniref:Uncharacterized protein n=1 Tax=bioreactor metagenome TaxID=1076179 RepID=A0A645HK62_9ZZZZ